jgi:hypothetical protein
MRSRLKQRTRSSLSGKSELSKAGAQLKKQEAWLPPGSVKSGLHGNDEDPSLDIVDDFNVFLKDSSPSDGV